MNCFDLLTDDIIIKILDRICDEIEVNLDDLEFNLRFIAVEEYMDDLWWRNHWNEDWRNHPDNGDPYDTDELDQFYQDEMYLNNLSSNI